jgi:hypothetical protein
MRCPVLVGRQAEVDRVVAWLDLLGGNDRGGLVVLAGEPGVGKSRLADELVARAAERGCLVLSGRSAPSETPAPYRPLRDALLPAFRTAPVPDDPSLAGFEGHLGRILPSVSAPVAEDSPILVAEAAVRLLALLAGDAGCVLVLEDVHWADAETAAVLEYFADGLAHSRVLCLATTRLRGTVDDVVDALSRRRPDRVVSLSPLPDQGVAEMIGSCLSTPDPPPTVRDFVVAHADGIPFVVEELLAGLVAAGQLEARDGHWETTDWLTPSVPTSMQASIGRRLAALGPTERRVLGAAALLGRHFAWELLPGIAEVDGRTAADALRAAVEGQLIDVDGAGFGFRHALTREVVLTELLPPERSRLAERAWPAIERAHPGLPGPLCGLAADLAEAAGDPATAADRLVESARRALDDGALATAEVTTRRARSLAAGINTSLALDADELLVRVLGASGKPLDALVLGKELTERFEAADVPAERQLNLLLAIARAAIAAGLLDEAHTAILAARRAVGDRPARALAARIDAVAGEVALDRAELAVAEETTRRAVEAARETDQPAVLCEALLTLGRIVRNEDTDAARSMFAEAAAVATGAGLNRWHLRAQQESALEDWMLRGAAPMEETRALAARYGAHVTVAVMDLSLADIALSEFDADACLRHASACVDASRRFGLATEPVANLWLAGAHALSGDDDGMHASIEASLARDPDDPRILADLYGRVLLTHALVRDELEDLRPLTDSMIEYVRRAPATQSVYPGRITWTLLCTIDDDDHGASARAELAEFVERFDFPMFREGARLIEAVALGRAGRPGAADALALEAYDVLAAGPQRGGQFQSTAMLVAGAAIRDEWGNPERWLRAAEAFFTQRSYDLLARRCRSLLVEAGAAVPRRRGTSEVPEALRALGVTGREVDVLRLVVAGCTNKEIAAQLVLSPKTVERHLSNLFGRLAVARRSPGSTTPA